MNSKSCFLLISVLLLAGVQFGNCWEDYELDLFDLVEELNQNFYDYFEVSHEVTSAELKKRYRRLSLEWHPDRNSDPEAELKFRTIVNVYEILKDKTKRRRYDQILIDGLPDWRHPSYYFRRARKLSTVELSIAVSLIISIGHYFVLWAQHFEKKLTLEERMSDVKKRLEKKQKKRNYKGSDLDDIDSEMQSYYDNLPSPVLKDTLPYRFSCWSFTLVISVPGFIKEKLSKKKTEVVEEEEVIQEPRVSRKKGSPEHLKLNPRNIAKSDIKATVTNQETLLEAKPEELSQKKNTSKEWSDKEKSELIKAISKYPAGTTSRWNKISDLLNRTPQDCINMEKFMKVNFTTSNYLNTNTWKEAKTTVLNHKEVPEPSVKLDENSNETKAEWSQVQQLKFESAIKEFNKETLNRWDRISEKVPQKSKDECINRYKSLCADLLKKKQERA